MDKKKKLPFNLVNNLCNCCVEPEWIIEWSRLVVSDTSHTRLCKLETFGIGIGIWNSEFGIWYCKWNWATGNRQQARCSCSIERLTTANGTKICKYCSYALWGRQWERQWGRCLLWPLLLPKSHDCDKHVTSAWHASDSADKSAPRSITDAKSWGILLRISDRWKRK